MSSGTGKLSMRVSEVCYVRSSGVIELPKRKLIVS